MSDSPIPPSNGGAEPADPSDPHPPPPPNDNSEYEDDDEDTDGRIHDLEEDLEDDMMAIIPEPIVKRVEVLKALNEKRDEMMQHYLEERAALEKKYSELCRPLYERRLDVVTGKADEELKVDSSPSDPPAEAIPSGVPQFWVCAMGHMDTVAELITEADVDCLEFLVDITCEEFSDGKGFKLNFQFEPNPYFENEVLTKLYDIPNLHLDDEPILKNVEGCEIKWKSGRALTHREVQKKQRSKTGKNAGQIRTVTRQERTDSLFHFFDPPKIPSLEEMDEEEADAIEEAFDHDFDIAQAFRLHLVPKAVLWFTGEALEEDVPGVLLEGEEAEILAELERQTREQSD